MTYIALVFFWGYDTMSHRLLTEGVMQESDKSILVRLERVRGRVDAAVRENFGYCPSDGWFDGLLGDIYHLEMGLKRNNPSLYQIYIDKYY
jgi:hypothetical protein